MSAGCVCRCPWPCYRRTDMVSSECCCCQWILIVVPKNVNRLREQLARLTFSYNRQKFIWRVSTSNLVLAKFASSGCFKRKCCARPCAQR